MYLITKHIDSVNGDQNSIHIYSDKEEALNNFASILQEELFFLEEKEWFEEFIEEYASSDYSKPITKLFFDDESLELWQDSDWIIVARYFDWCCDSYSIQLIECLPGLSINL